MLDFPIYFKRQYDDKLELHINSFKDEHNTLYYFLQGSDVINKIELTSSKIILEKIDKAGIYNFYTKGTLSKSKTMKLYFHKLRPNEIFDIILKENNILDSKDDGWKNKYVNTIKRQFVDNPEKPLIEYIIDLFKTVEDIEDDEILFFYSLIYGAQTYLNNLSYAMNLSTGYTNTPYYNGEFNINFKNHVESVSLFAYDCDIKQYRYESHVVTKESYRINSCNDVLYKILLKSQDNSICGQFYYYQFNDKYSSELWHNHKDRLDDLKNNVIGNINLSSYLTTLSDAEKIYYLKEKYIEPQNKICSHLEIVKNCDYVEVFTKDYDFVKEANKKYYVTTIEDDVMTEDIYRHNTEITNSIVRIDKTENYMSGNTLFFITDSEGAIISPITRFNVSDSEDMIEYNTNKSMVDFEIYKNHLTDTLKSLMPEVIPFITDRILYLYNKTDFNIDELYENLILEVIIYYVDRQKMTNIIYAILYDYISYFEHGPYIINDKVKYAYSRDIFTFPVNNENEYVVCVGILDNENNYIKQYYHSKNTGLSIETRDNMFSWMFAIDLKDYSLSGFILIDSRNHVNPTILTDNIQIERM